jgi:hypothetical protein
MNDFQQLLAIAHNRLVMLDELRACNIAIVFMRGAVCGCFSTLVALAVGYGIWRLL